jgi:hypothetical protein
MGCKYEYNSKHRGREIGKRKKKAHGQWVHGKGRVGDLIRTACPGLRGPVQHVQYNQYLEPGDAGIRLNTATRS